MLKIKKGDMVQVIAGDDRGKKGKVLRILPGGKRALVEGVNLVKKHRRKTQQDQTGGIVSIESPLGLEKLMYFCKRCSAPVRVGFVPLKDGTKTRVCKACKEVL